MELLHATQDTRGAPDGLLTIVDSVGIPVLVRPYGEVQKPPSAAVGIVSALFHAAKRRDQSELRVLRSHHRSIAYVQQDGDILLAFAQAQGDEVGNDALQSTERMLRVVFRALQMAVGPSITTMDSSRLRVALARQVVLIDYIVIHSASDARLSLERSLFGASSSQSQLAEASRPQSFLYGAWLSRSVILHEFCSAGGLQIVELDPMLLFLLAEVGRGIKKAPITAHIDTAKGPLPVLITFAACDHSDPDHCLLGLFTGNATTSDIATFTNEACKRHDQLMSLNNIPSTLNSVLPPSFRCCLVAPLESRENNSRARRRRVVVFAKQQHDKEIDASPANPTTEIRSITDDDSLAMLSHFAWTCRSSSSTMPFRSDFIQIDESCTFVQCIRRPLCIYALFGDQMSLENVIKFGDAVASHFLWRRCEH